MSPARSGRWWRRAQPLLGTVVEVGAARDGIGPAALDRAFARVREVERRLSRFDAASDIGRFDAMDVGDTIDVAGDTQTVLAAAAELGGLSAGLFDVSLGTGAEGWRCEGRRLTKLRDGVRLDLGGIGKGHAVDRAVQVLLDDGACAGWVNAGGDLRCFGAVDLPVELRDERRGGVRPFAALRNAAFATSRLVSGKVDVQVSVAARECLWADALTKVVALSGDPDHPALARFGATAWLRAL